MASSLLGWSSLMRRRDRIAMQHTLVWSTHHSTTYHSTTCKSMRFWLLSQHLTYYHMPPSCENGQPETEGSWKTAVSDLSLKKMRLQDTGLHLKYLSLSTDGLCWERKMFQCNAVQSALCSERMNKAAEHCRSALVYPACTALQWSAMNSSEF